MKKKNKCAKIISIDENVINVEFEQWKFLCERDDKLISKSNLNKFRIYDTKTEKAIIVSEEQFRNRYTTLLADLLFDDILSKYQNQQQNPEDFFPEPALYLSWHHQRKLIKITNIEIHFL